MFYSSVTGIINFGSHKGENIYDVGVTIVIFRQCSDKTKSDKDYYNSKYQLYTYNIMSTTSVTLIVYGLESS